MAMPAPSSNADFNIVFLRLLRAAWAGARAARSNLCSRRVGGRAQGYTSAAAFDDTLACRQSKAPAGVADRAPWQLHGREARHSGEVFP